jgi:tetratricopeptide (TPR) repeat protein
LDPRSRAHCWAVCGFLLLAVGIVFGQTLSHPFIGYDDSEFVSENPHVTAGLTLSGLWWALTDGPFGEWTPLSTLSQMLDCQLYGLHPAGHYLTNVLLHAASSVLLLLVLLRMTGDLWPSAWVAAVFAIHPLHVESVAWLAERRDVLSGLFFMLTLGAYALYAERPSPARYLTVAGCLALGLMAKPMLVTVPFLLLLLDYWPLGRFRHAAGAPPPAKSSPWFARLPVGWRLAVEKVPLLALAAADCAIVLSTHMSLRLNEAAEPLSLSIRLQNALVAYAAYLGQSLWPINVSPYYPHRGTHLPMAWAAESLVLLLAVTVVAACFWRRLPCLLVGWLWFLGMLTPVIGVMGTFLHARADRYTYLSQIGLSIGLAWGVWTVYRARQSLPAARWRQSLLAALSAATLLALAAVAWRQTSYWRDRETLWTRALACTEQNLVAHYSLAIAYAQQGRTDEAIAQLRAGLAVDSTAIAIIAEAHTLLAHCLTLQGKADEALTHFELAVRLLPSDDRCHARLAVALGLAGQPDRAIAEWREAVRLAPAALGARLGLADALLSDGQAGEAVDQCREVLKQEPNAVEAIVILALALSAEGQGEEAVQQLNQALALQPQHAQAHFQLGRILLARGLSPSAAAHLHEAIRLQPDNVPMLWQTAWFLATNGDPSFRNGARAVDLARQATQLSGGQEPRTLDALAAALAENKEFSAAVETAEQASKLAQARNDQALADAIRQRTRLYRQGMPYRE